MKGIDFMKFKEYVEKVNKMLEEHPEYGEMEMEQTERWAGEEVILPERIENDEYYNPNIIYI